MIRDKTIAVNDEREWWLFVTDDERVWHQIEHFRRVAPSETVDLRYGQSLLRVAAIRKTDLPAPFVRTWLMRYKSRIGDPAVLGAFAVGHNAMLLARAVRELSNGPLVLLDAQEAIA
jgi:hypothetical protein